MSTGRRTSGRAGKSGFEKSAVRRSPRGWAGASAESAAVFSGTPEDAASTRPASEGLPAASGAPSSVFSVEATVTAAAGVSGAAGVSEASAAGFSVPAFAISCVDTRTPVTAASAIVTPRSNHRPET